MADTRMDAAEPRIRWRNPVLRFDGVSPARPEAVYDLLADLRSHMEWAGRRQRDTTRLLTLEAPPGPAKVGTEFFSTGSDGKVARWSDRSVVTEATRPEVFEFVTEGRREGKPGSRPWLATAVHRYEIAREGGGCRVTYTEDLTRLAGAPGIFYAPGISRLIWKISAKYMRRGFDNLLALAEEEERAVAR
ncbi:MAG TPA: SRPBCC family protein [Actinomycetota bacterium]|nr:SRPBCC family protein [Actinomycetota bacterium]